jgi:hypothetical protein
MSRKKSKLTNQLSWRPDFRVVAELPDIKVVRTDFLVNAGAIALLIAILSFYGYLEYSVMSLNGEVMRLDGEVAGKSADNKNVLEDHAAFETLKVTIETIEDFVHANPSPPEILQIVSALQPEKSVLNQIDFRTILEKGSAVEGVTYELKVQGSIVGTEKRSAPELISDFKSELSAHESWADIIIGSEVSFQRKVNLGVFDYTITLRLKKKAIKS